MTAQICVQISVVSGVVPPFNIFVFVCLLVHGLYDMLVFLSSHFLFRFPNSYDFRLRT